MCQTKDCTYPKLNCLKLNETIWLRAGEEGSSLLRGAVFRIYLEIIYLIYVLEGLGIEWSTIVAMP